MFRQSRKNCSGNPHDLPIQSLPLKAEREALRLVGPMAIGVVAPGVLSPPDAYVVDVAGVHVLSMGNSVLSIILLVIHFSTSSMYRNAGSRVG